MRTSNPGPSVTGVILVGGQSKRFGTDKAAYRTSSGTFTEIVLRALQDVLPDVIISGRPEQTKLPPGARFIADKIADGGPLAGLSSAFEATSSEWLFVTACDMPGITSSAIRHILSYTDRNSDAIVARTSDNRQHPLFACYRRTTADDCEAVLRSSRKSMHSLLGTVGQNGLVLYPTVSRSVVHNVNRMDDLVR